MTGLVKFSLSPPQGLLLGIPIKRVSFPFPLSSACFPSPKRSLWKRAKFFLYIISPMKYCGQMPLPKKKCFADYLVGGLQLFRITRDLSGQKRLRIFGFSSTSIKPLPWHPILSCQIKVSITSRSCKIKCWREPNVPIRFHPPISKNLKKFFTLLVTCYPKQL